MPSGLDISEIIDGRTFEVYAHGIIGRNKENGYSKMQSLLGIACKANFEPTSRIAK